MDKNKKKVVLDELNNALGDAQAIFVTDFKGLPMATLSQLRQKVRNANGTFKISKNTLIRLALGTGNGKVLVPYLVGNTGLAYTKADPVILAKALTDFAKEESRFVVKSGYLGEKLLVPQEVTVLSSLPSKEVLLSSFLGTLNAVPGSFVRVLAGVPQKFLRLLVAIGEQKSQNDTEPQAQAT
jgi:large subunit ribosomal protein L10